MAVYKWYSLTLSAILSAKQGDRDWYAAIEQSQILHQHDFRWKKIVQKVLKTVFKWDGKRNSFGKINLRWFFMLDFQKRKSSVSSWKKISEQNLDFCGSYFWFLLWKWVFRTDKESHAAVTLHYKDLEVQNYLFLKDACLYWLKI